MFGSEPGSKRPGRAHDESCLRNYAVDSEEFRCNFVDNPKI